MTQVASEQITSEKKRRGRNQTLGLLIGILISVAILAAFVFSVNWDAFLNELGNVHYHYIPLFAVVFYLTYWIRALRWRYLLPQSDSLDTKVLFDSFSLGSLAMFILPFRAGEIVRAFTLQRWSNNSFAVGFASIITERAFDVISLLVLFGICLTQFESAPSEVISAAWVLGSIAVAIIAVMLLCYFLGEFMRSLFQRLLRLVLQNKLLTLQERLVHFASGIIEGFRAIRSVKELLIVFISSLVLWLVFGLLFQIGMWCFGIFPNFWVGVTVSVIVALAIAIPSAPGFLGVYQLGCALALSGIFGYSTEYALAYAVLTHTLQFILVFLIGFWVLRARGITLSDLRKRANTSAA